MGNLLPVQTHLAGDVEIKTKIVCTPEVFRALLSQHGKVFRLADLSYEPLKDSAILTWIPQLPIVHVETMKGKQ